MKRNNKSLLLAAALVLSLSSCGGISDTPSSEDSGDISTSASTDISTSTSASSDTSTSDSTPSTSEVDAPTFAKVIEQLHGEIAISGKLQENVTFTDNGEEDFNPIYIDTVFGGDYFYQANYGNERGTPESLKQHYKDSEGYAVTRTLNPTTNEISERREVGYDADWNPYEVVFDDEYGIFKTFTEEDFTYGNGEAILKLDAQEAYMVDFVLSGYELMTTPDELKITYDKDYNITSFYVEVFGSSSNWDGREYTYHFYLDFDVIDVETLNIVHVEQRKDSDKIEAIDTLFTSLQENNYTVEVSAVDVFSGSPVDTLKGNIYSTSEGIIIDNQLTSEQTGYLQIEDKVAPVQLESDQKLHGTAIPSVGSVTDLNPEFNYFSSMFTETADNEYTLLDIDNLYNWDYIFAIAPEYLLSEGNINPDDGSYKLTKNSDDTWTVTYKVFYDYYDFGSDLTLTAIIKNIGTTALPYGIDDYVEFVQPQSWAEIDGATELLANYGITSELPFYYLEGLTFEIYGANSFRTSSLPEGMTTTQIRDNYAAMLLAAGWEYKGTDSFFNNNLYGYKLANGNQLNIGLSDVYDSLIIYLNEQSVETELSRWIKENFTDSMNYTIDVTISEELHEYDPDTYLMGDLIETNDYTFEIKQTDVAQVTTGNMFALDYAYIQSTGADGITKINEYTRDNETAGSSWVYSSQEETTFKDSFYTMSNLVDAGYYSEGYDAGEYLCSDSSVIELWYKMLYVDYMNTGTYLGDTMMQFALDGTNNTLSINYWTIFSSIVTHEYADGTTTPAFLRATATVTISDVGTTTINTGEITGESFGGLNPIN